MRSRVLGFAITLALYTLYYPATQYTAQLSPVDVLIPLDQSLPLIPFFMLIYAMIYPIGIFPIFLVGDVKLFKRVIWAYCTLEMTTMICFVLFPVHMTIRPKIHSIEINTFWDWCLCLCYHLDLPTCCFPSLHVSVSILSALCCWKVNRVWGTVIGVIAFLISISTLLVKQHFIADVVLGATLAYGSYRIYLFPYQDESHSQMLPTKFTLIPVSFFLGIVGSAYCAYLQNYQPWI